VNQNALIEGSAAPIEAMCRDHQALCDLIRKSQETIEHSKALLKRLDKVLGKAGA
jgi:hypothetical protein